MNERLIKQLLRMTGGVEADYNDEGIWTYYVYDAGFCARIEITEAEYDYLNNLMKDETYD